MSNTNKPHIPAYGDPEHPDYYAEQFAQWLRREFLLLRLDLAEDLLKQADTAQQIDLKNLPPTGTVTDTLNLPLEVKAADDTSGAVTGYLSTWDLDLGNDIVVRGAYKDTIARAQAHALTHGSAALWPLLWQHQKDEPIGGITSAREDAKGLLIHAKLNLSIERGRQAYHGLKHGYLAFSIGFKPLKVEWKGNTRYVKAIALSEGSAVTWPMNPHARALPTNDDDQGEGEE